MQAENNSTDVWKKEIKCSGFSMEDRGLYETKLKSLEKTYVGMEKNWLDMASDIYPIYKKRLYRIDGFRNIYEFAKEKFNISKSTCSMFIQVCEQFGEFSQDGIVEGLKPGYEGYTISKLQILITVDEKSHRDFSPEMTVREMKQLKKQKESPLLNKSGPLLENDMPAGRGFDSIDVFGECFSTYDEIMERRNDIKEACLAAKKKNPDARFRIIVEGVSNEIRI